MTSSVKRGVVGSSRGDCADATAATQANRTIGSNPFFDFMDHGDPVRLMGLRCLVHRR